MPASRPRASFEPIPPDFDVRAFVESADNFSYVDRISYEMIKNNGTDQFEKLILLHVIIGGKPLVIDSFEEVLDPWTFTPSWLRDNQGDKVENARNLIAKDNIPLTIRHYLKHMGKLTDQFFEEPERYRDKSRQRIYLKDIDCPQVWQDKLKELIPSMLFYLNESTGEVGGPGAPDEPNGRKGKGIARAGDLMSSLPPEMRAENLMCYIGHEGTYTPAHREMCASLGQNIMVNASTTISEDGKPEHPGSSLWFMTETKDRHLVSEYWLSVLGHDIEVENHFAQLIAWKKAPFHTYVVEQRPGDFILIPPLAPHQVWNRGTRTMKVAWNRTTVETLEMAISEALPNSRVVCRDEQYKNKAIIYYTLLKYSNLIKTARAQVELGGEYAEAIQRSVKVRQLQRDFKRLFELYKTILLSEMFAPNSREHPEYLPYDSNVTCAYCRCNIFNRFMTCKACPFGLGTETEEPYDVCMDCYCMGRSCACQSGYTWVEQWKWKDLVTKYEEWRAQIIDIDGHVTEKTPLPLAEERRYLGKKTLAQVCQEQLKLRPFVDPKNPEPLEDESAEEEIQINEDGTVKKMVKKRSKTWLNNNKACHFCIHRHAKWKMAFCTNCDLAYCYGALFRAHDMMPLTVMENTNWKCPHCNRTCNTGQCRKDPRQHPYEPKGTLLGHDTRKVADVRSVECLVDFSVSNLNWIKEDEAAGIDSTRLQRRRIEAELAKQHDPTQDDRFVDENHHEQMREGIEYSPVEDSMMIDPSLGGAGDVSFMSAAGPSNGHFGQDGPLHQGYVEPSAVMYGYQPDDGSVVGDYTAGYYPNPDLNGEIPRYGNKRNRENGEDDEEIRRDGKSKKSKKKRDDTTITPLQPKTASAKQYQKEVERKLLEEAKKEGRFILVAARMKGKSRIVKLSLRPELLERFRPQRTVRPAPASRPGADEPVADTGSILQSDVLPPANGTSQPGPKPKAAKSFRVRVEKDDEFKNRRRGDDANGASSASKQKGSQFEEVTLDSEEEEDLEEVEYTPFRRTGRPKKRDSAWLARKNQGEEDLPTELPADFRDGTINRHREQDRKRRKTMPHAKPQAQIRPPGAKPSRNSTGNMDMSDEDGVHEVDDTVDQSAVLLAQSAAATMEAARKAEEEKLAAQKADEENLRARMAIGDWAEDSENESLYDFIENRAAQDEQEEREHIQISSASPSSSEDEAEPEPEPEKEPEPESSPGAPPAPTTKSIFSRPGMRGRKIKIVSASAKCPGTSNSNSNSNSVSTPKPAPSTSTPSTSVQRHVTQTTTTITAPVSSFTPVNQAAVRARGRGRPSGINRAVVQLSESEDSEDEIPAKAPSASVEKRGGRGPVSTRGARGGGVSVGGRGGGVVSGRGGGSGRGKRGRPRGRPRGS